MVKIVKAKAGDFEGFYKLWQKTLRDGSFLYPKRSAPYLLKVSLPKKAQLKKEILSGKKLLYVARNNEKIIGYLLTNEDFAGVVFGNWLGVDSQFRHKGIGSKLLQIWEKEAVKSGVHALQLWTTENDLGFYQKNDFILGGKFKKAWFGLDHFFFYKIVGQPKPQKYV